MSVVMSETTRRFPRTANPIPPAAARYAGALQGPYRAPGWRLGALAWGFLGLCLVLGGIAVAVLA